MWQLILKSFPWLRKAHRSPPATSPQAASPAEATPPPPAGKPNTQALQVQHIAHLNPINKLPERVIGYLARLAKPSSHAKGSVIFLSSEELDKHAIYLLSGCIEFRPRDGKTRQLSSKEAAAKSPITFESNTKDAINVMERSILLRFPLSLIQDAEKNRSMHSDKISAQRLSEEQQHLFKQLVTDVKLGKLELPSPPDLGIRIGKALEKQGVSSDDIARIIQLDPALTARLIQLCNSPLYSGLGKIKDCPTAVTRLGLTTTRNLALIFLLKNIFNNSSAVLQKIMDQLWHDGAHIAAISSILAKSTPGLEPGRAMLAGLIHQVGAIAIINNAHRHPQLMADPQLLDLAIETLTPQLGKIILEKWNLGEDLVDVVAHAANWMRDNSPSPTYTDVVVIAKLHANIGKSTGKYMPRIDLVPAFHKLALGELTPRKSLVILELAEKDVQSVQQLLG
jgi:HD-like signal output (HDOD) protein